MQNNPREARTLSQMRRQKEQRRRQNKNRLMVLTAFFLITTTVLSFSFIAFFESGFLVSTQEDSSQSETQRPSSSVDTQPSEPSIGEDGQELVEQFVLPENVQKTINTMSMQASSSRMLAVAENGTVDLSYFNDATFIGDSLAQGFVEAYDTFPNSGSVAFKSMSSDGFVTKLVEDANGNAVSPIELVAQSNPTKAYILIGVNDLVWMSDDQMVASFTMLVDALATRIPGLQIYLMSVPPQTASRGTDERYSVIRINTLNDRLAVMARERNIYFVDLHEVLADDQGNLKAEIAAPDGFHLTPQGYIMIREYLQTHTVHSPTNPYLEGSPLYDIVDPSVDLTTTVDNTVPVDGSTT